MSWVHDDPEGWDEISNNAILKMFKEWDVETFDEFLDVIDFLWSDATEAYGALLDAVSDYIDTCTADYFASKIDAVISQAIILREELQEKVISPLWTPQE